jgi:hypothetical protein
MRLAVISGVQFGMTGIRHRRSLEVEAGHRLLTATDQDGRLGLPISVVSPNPGATR